jgi:hypothetical protein
MKKIFLLLVLCLIGVAVFVNYTFDRVFDNDHDISIKVREKENLYELRASYEQGKNTHAPGIHGPAAALRA